jgi:GxxExxY protein
MRRRWDTCWKNADLIVNERVIVEITSAAARPAEAVEAIAPVHKKQLPTYLKLAGKRLGVLINFNVFPINRT